MANPTANPTIKKPTAVKFAKKSKSSRKLAKKAALDREFKNLKLILPTVNSRPNVDEITILNETVKMISHLERQVFAKLAQANRPKIVMPASTSILHELLLMQQMQQNADKSSTKSAVKREQ